MVRSANVFLPLWVSWVVYLLLVLVWMLLTYVLIVASQPARTSAWFLVTEVLLVVAVVIGLMLNKRKPRPPRAREGQET